MPPKFQAAGSAVAAGILTLTWLHVTATPVFAHGDLHERIQALTQQLQTNAGNTDLWLQRADLNRQHGDYTLATADASEAARLRPDWPAAVLERARILFDTGAPAAAAAAATACLQLDAANPDALVIRARCRAQLGQLAGTVTDFNRALAPTNGPRPLPDLYLERARAQAALGRVERAQKFFPPEKFLALRGEILSLANRPAEVKTNFPACRQQVSLPPANIPEAPDAK